MGGGSVDVESLDIKCLFLEFGETEGFVMCTFNENNGESTKLNKKAARFLCSGSGIYYIFRSSSKVRLITKGRYERYER